MKLFDAHNHIQDKRLFPDLGNVMQRARKTGVVKMGVKGCSEEDWSTVIQIAQMYEGIYPSFGLHPWFIVKRSPSWLQTLEDLLIQFPNAAVGEIGIDHAIEERDDADQEKVFFQQLELARKLNRPVSIHCRRAWGRLIELLDQFGELPRGMLIHCFGGSAEIATELVKRGGYISFSGSITRPNARKAGPAIRAVPDDRILIETDAPDILPTTADGPLNEPANVKLVLEKAAEFKGCSQEELADLTFRNAERFFHHGRDAHATNRGTGVPPVIPQLPSDYTLGNWSEEFHIRYGAYLPHWTRNAGVYAVTFRLADSLPPNVLASWVIERDNILEAAKTAGRALSDHEAKRLQDLHAERVESFLDSGAGACWLQHEPIAQIVKDALFHFDGDRYAIQAWCIMPNHVHVVFQPLEGQKLPDILHSWKSFSAKKANRLLERFGDFWQPEYYDHLIRDEEDFRHAVTYVLENPEKAGLKNWPWVGVRKYAH
ncbi:TatD family hydrolase [Pontiellaceae bacterium B1224]|nr:TatD family hydrolase [Pontiellaceae bacterium B1224]